MEDKIMESMSANTKLEIAVEIIAETSLYNAFVSKTKFGETIPFFAYMDAHRC